MGPAIQYQIKSPRFAQNNSDMTQQRAGLLPLAIADRADKLRRFAVCEVGHVDTWKEP